jgi:hypothetical protein
MQPARHSSAIGAAVCDWLPSVVQWKRLESPGNIATLRVSVSFVIVIDAKEKEESKKEGNSNRQSPFNTEINKYPLERNFDPSAAFVPTRTSFWTRAPT